MARVFAHLEGDAPRPIELKLATEVHRWGVRAVTGRDLLSAGEIRDMDYAETLENIIRAKHNSGDWAEYSKKNPDAEKVYDLAAKQYIEWMNEHGE